MTPMLNLHIFVVHWTKKLARKVYFDAKSYRQNKMHAVCSKTQNSHWRSNLDKSPESRACPRATQQGCAKCGGTSPCQQSWHKKKFRRKADKKTEQSRVSSNFLPQADQWVFKGYMLLSWESEFLFCYFEFKFLLALS